MKLMWKPGLLLIFLALFIPLSSVGQHDTVPKEPHMISFSLGIYNISRPAYYHGLYEVEFYPRWKIWFFYPFAGAFINTYAKGFIFAGITVPIRPARHFLFRISFAPGFYTVSDENKDLGYPLEFRTSIKFAWIFRNQSRLGIEGAHLSKPGLHAPNPGCETLVISYEIPLAPPKQAKQK